MGQFDRKAVFIIFMDLAGKNKYEKCVMPIESIALHIRAYKVAYPINFIQHWWTVGHQAGGTTW